jgi:serine protease Do
MQRESRHGISIMENVMSRFKGTRSKWALFGAFLASAMACLGAPFQLTPEAKRVLEFQPAVVKVVVSVKTALLDAKGRQIIVGICGGTGSGFLYRPDGYLITNGHVVEDAKDDDARAETEYNCLSDLYREKFEPQLSHDQALRKIVLAVRSGEIRRVEERPSIKVLLDNARDPDGGYNGEVKQFSMGAKDVAIVKIDGSNLPTVELGSSAGVNVGDPITVIGYPGNANISERSLLVPTVTNGRISAIKDREGTPVLQSEAPISHGNSGGPAFDSSGRVIGVATFYKGEKGEEFNFFVPIDTALEFVRSAGALPQRGLFDQTWHDALDAYANQKWATAHDLMGRVLEIMPDQPDAKRLQLEAGNAPPETHWTTLVAVGGGTLAVLLGIGGFMIAKRGSRNQQPIPQPAATGKAAVPEAAAAETTHAKPAVVLQAHPVGETFGSLQISNGPLAGNRFAIPKSGLMIGRDPSVCAVVLPSDTVGKEHAWVVPLDNGVALIDRNSVNGTYVNSTESPRVNKVVLKDGDRIFVGRKDPTEIMYFRK